MLTAARLVVQLGLGLVFLLSAIGKLNDPRAFARGVVEYRILPRLLAYFVGLALIPLEVFLSTSHLVGWRLELAAPTGFVMLLSFTIAVAVNLRRGTVLPCYCFGGTRGGEMISGRTLVRLVLLLAGEVLLLFTGDPLSEAGPTVYGQAGSLRQLGLALFWASFVLLAGSWLLSFVDVVDLISPFRRTYDRKVF